MDRFLTRLERRFGRHAPEHVTLWMVGFTAVGYLLLYTRPELGSLFVLTREGLLRGELWRLVTFLLMPWQLQGGMLGPVFMIFAFLFLYSMGSALEQQWGAFRYDLFLLLSVAGTVLAALLVGGVTNEYIFLSLSLAFAVEFPDYEILLFFVLPVKMKWVGMLSGAFLLFEFLSGDLADQAGILVAMGSFLLFCGGTLRDRVQGRARLRGRAAAQERLRAESRQVARVRVCARCGRSEKDDPHLEFRVCDCQERCGGKLTDYCLEHARAH
jgi:hypothetical protein